MKFFHIIFLSIFTILYGQSAWPFQIGEKLTYNVSFTGITAGQASLEIVNDAEINNHHQLHIRYIAKTTFPLRAVYAINDQIDTWLDSKYLYTKKLTKKIFCDKNFSLMNTIMTSLFPHLEKIEIPKREILFFHFFS